MKNPLVSVLMTAHNRERFITESIESVLASTYCNFELIIVDDCSTDNTLRIAKEFEAQDKRIKVFSNKENLTDFPNRNKAATYANGKYLKYLDSDDTIFPEGLAYCVEQMEKHPESSFGISMIDGDHSKPSMLMESEEVIRKHLFQSIHLAAGPTGMIIRKKLFVEIGGFDTRFRMANDSFFNMKVATRTPVVLLKKVYFYYRMHETQEQNNPKGYFIYGYLANMEMIQKLKLPLAIEEINILKKRFRKQHAKGLLKLLILKGRIKEVFFIMKETKFGIMDVVKGLIY